MIEPSLIKDDESHLHLLSVYVPLSTSFAPGKMTGRKSLWMSLAFLNASKELWLILGFPLEKLVGWRMG